MLQIIALNHVKHKPTGSYVFLLVYKLRVTIHKMDEDDEVVDCNLSGTLPLKPILFLESAELHDSQPDDFLLF